jgi:hypothetical protein
MEHRWGRRSNASAEVRLYVAGLPASQPGCILNASASGAFIETTIKPRLLQCMQVEIRMPTAVDVEVVRVLACVVRRTAVGVGVEWCDGLPFAIDDLTEAFPAPFHRVAQAGRSLQSRQPSASQQQPPCT